MTSHEKQAIADALHEIDKLRLLYNALYWADTRTKDMQAEFMAHLQRATNILKDIGK